MPKEYFSASLCPVLQISELKEHNGESTLEVVLQCTGYCTGDNLAVFPENDCEKVRGLAESQEYSLSASSPLAGTVQDALTKFCDFSGAVRQHTLLRLVEFTSDPAERRALQHLGSPAGKTEYSEQLLQARAGLLEVFERFPSLKVPFEAFMDLTGRIVPRYYTIASSSLEDPGKVSLVVDVISEGPFKGLCSSYFASMYRTGIYRELRAFTVESAFRPRTGTTVMVATGSGLAPFRGLIREADYLKASDCHIESRAYPELYLYYGCKFRESHFLYSSEIIELTAHSEHIEKHQITGQSKGVVAKLYGAFSREGPCKCYVQDILRLHKERVWDWLNSGVTFLVCGNKSMGNSVLGLLKEIALEQLGDSGSEFIQGLREQHLICLEVW